MDTVKTKIKIVYLKDKSVLQSNCHNNCAILALQRKSFVVNYMPFRVRMLVSFNALESLQIK